MGFCLPAAVSVVVGMPNHKQYVRDKARRLAAKEAEAAKKQSASAAVEVPKPAGDVLATASVEDQPAASVLPVVKTSKSSNRRGGPDMRVAIAATLTPSVSGRQ